MNGGWRTQPSRSSPCFLSWDSRHASIRKTQTSSATISSARLWLVDQARQFGRRRSSGHSRLHGRDDHGVSRARSFASSSRSASAMKLPPMSWSPSDGAYLDNIVVTKKGTGGKGAAPDQRTRAYAGRKSSGFRVHQSGRQANPSELVRGPRPARHVRLHAMPVSDVLPAGFAKLRGNLRADAQESRARFESSPAHDQLRSHARHAEGSSRLRWIVSRRGRRDSVRPLGIRRPLAAGPEENRGLFRAFLHVNGGQIVHSLSTTVISPEGTVYKWYEDNQWTPTELVTDASAALQQENSSTTVAKSDRAERRAARELDIRSDGLLNAVPLVL